MPIALSFSREFRDKLGDEVTNELVTWLNAVDQSYRQEFRELFEAHFGRLEERMNAFEAKLGAKLEKQKSEMLRWIVLFWVGTMGTIIAVLKL